MIAIGEGRIRNAAGWRPLNLGLRPTRSTVQRPAWGQLRPPAGMAALQPILTAIDPTRWRRVSPRPPGRHRHEEPRVHRVGGDHLPLGCQGACGWMAIDADEAEEAVEILRESLAAERLKLVEAERVHAVDGAQQAESLDDHLADKHERVGAGSSHCLRDDPLLCRRSPRVRCVCTPTAKELVDRRRRAAGIASFEPLPIE